MADNMLEAAPASPQPRGWGGIAQAPLPTTKSLTLTLRVPELSHVQCHMRCGSRPRPAMTGFNSVRPGPGNRAGGAARVRIESVSEVDGPDDYEDNPDSVVIGDGVEGE